MTIDYKKTEKELYLPKTTPSVIDVPQMTFITVEWRYYNDGKAWLAKGLYKWTGARGGQKENTVFWLSIWDSFFKVTIYFPEKNREEVLRLPLDNKVKLMMADSKQMGKLRSFPLVFDLCWIKCLGPFLLLLILRKA
jgi:hypothetical protein